MILLPTVVAVVRWSAFNYAAVGAFSLTAASGVDLYTHVKDCVEDAPPRYATIEEVDKDVRRANGGAAPAEWEVAHEVARREGRTVPEVSSEMLALSVREIATHPLQYVRNVAVGTVRFGRDQDESTSPGKARVVYSERSGRRSNSFSSWSWALAFLAALAAVASRLRQVMRAPRGRAWVFLAAVVAPLMPLSGDVDLRGGRALRDAVPAGLRALCRRLLLGGSEGVAQAPRPGCRSLRSSRRAPTSRGSASSPTAARSSPSTRSRAACTSGTPCRKGPQARSSAASSVSLSSPPRVRPTKGVEHGEPGRHLCDPMGGDLLRRKRECCHPREAAERLGITVDEVLDLISTGELSALTFMDDDRWFIDRDDLDRVARKAQRQGTDPDGRVRRAGLLQLLWRCLDAIF